MAALRALIAHPQFDLVGVRVYSDAKAGVDAGQLCGVPPTGIIATKSIGDIIAAEPDCVVYMPSTYDVDDLCLLLKSGINISTLLEHFHDPDELATDLRERIEAACQVGGTSLLSAGTSPGFVTEALPVVLTSLQRRLDRLTINEYADISARNSPEMLSMLFGGDPLSDDVEAIVTGIAESCRQSYGASLRTLAKALSTPLDAVTASARVATAKSPVETAAGTFSAGTVAAWRIEVTGLRAGVPLLQIVPTWYISTDLDPDWNIPFPGQGWHVVVEGDTPLDVTIRFTWESESDRGATGFGNASRPVNAVPYACEAAPGIVTSFELPQLIPNLS